MLYEKTSVREELQRSDIIDGVKTQASALGTCITAARARGTLSAGRVVFHLNWVIEPNGSVTRPSVSSEQGDDDLRSCMLIKLFAWHFPASRYGRPIANFPLPVNVH